MPTRELLFGDKVEESIYELFYHMHNGLAATYDQLFPHYCLVVKTVPPADSRDPQSRLRKEMGDWNRSFKKVLGNRQFHCDCLLGDKKIPHRICTVTSGLGNKKTKYFLSPHTYIEIYGRVRVQALVFEDLPKPKSRKRNRDRSHVDSDTAVAERVFKRRRTVDVVSRAHRYQDLPTPPSTLDETTNDDEPYSSSSSVSTPHTPMIYSDWLTSNVGVDTVQESPAPVSFDAYWNAMQVPTDGVPDGQVLFQEPFDLDTIDPLFNLDEFDWGTDLLDLPTVPQLPMDFDVDTLLLDLALVPAPAVTSLLSNNFDLDALLSDFAPVPVSTSTIEPLFPVDFNWDALLLDLASVPVSVPTDLSPPLAETQELDWISLFLNTSDTDSNRPKSAFPSPKLRGITPLII